MFQVQIKLKFSALIMIYEKYLTVNCISLVYYLKNAYISGNLFFFA